MIAFSASSRTSQIWRALRFLTLPVSLVVLGGDPSYATPCVGLAAAAASALGATCDDGTAPIGIFGTVIAADGTGYQADPFAAPDYDYVLNSPMGLGAGDAVDFHWVHESSGTGAASGTQWSFAIAATEFILYPSIDHAPIPEEGLEGTLWGSADNGATWLLGRLVHIWEDGANAASLDDDYASLWLFSAPVDRISATAGLVQSDYSFPSTDVEIDAVAIHRAPEPGILLILGAGLLAALRRSRRG
jgi:hypothetical protein